MKKGLELTQCRVISSPVSVSLLWDRTGLCVQMEDFLASEGLFCRTDSGLNGLPAAARGGA